MCAVSKSSSERSYSRMAEKGSKVSFGPDYSYTKR